jgi:PAS domain S-box-containing protein
MRTNWENIHDLVSRNDESDLRYLAVIDENGRILKANDRMTKGFHLGQKSNSTPNFFELIHPVHAHKFKKLITEAEIKSDAASMELYLRNGQFHPMKWNVNVLSDVKGLYKIYFCEGFKIVDDVRSEKFNRLVKMNYEMGIEGPVSIMFHDAEGELIAINQQTVDMFGVSMEMIYKISNLPEQWNNNWGLRNEDDELISFEDAPFRKALRSGMAEKMVIKANLKEKGTRWFLWHSQLLPPDELTGELFSVSNIIDITNERCLINSLSANEVFYKSFIKQMPGISWIIDDEQRLVFGSDSFFRQYGIIKNEALNKKILDLVPEPVSKALYEHHMRVFKTGMPEETMHKLRLMDGTWTVYHIKIFNVEGISGSRLVGGLAIPIADNNRIEMELREANDRLVLLRRATSDAIWEWDMQTGIMVRNEALMEMVGYHGDTSGGLSWWLRRIHAEDRNRVSDKVKEATEKHLHSWQESYRFKCSNGEYKFVQDKGFVIYENGLPVKMIGSLTDISNLKELEGALEAEKVQKQKEISETVVRVQEFERTRIGHELHDNVNQILSTVKLFMDLLKPDTREQKAIKDKSIDYVLLAIEEIRKLSKELAVPQLKEEGLANSVQSIINDLHMASAIQIRFDHDEEIENLSSGKKITLFRIVQEQLKNILKHSKARNAEISMQIIEDTVTLKITDDGIGFDPKHAHQGIGLTNICERAQFYSGGATVISAKGKGCTVVVSLPFQ